jgi:hypothetical protein
VILQPTLPCADNARDVKVRGSIASFVLPFSSVLSADLFASGVVLILVLLLQSYLPCVDNSWDVTIGNISNNVTVFRIVLVGCGPLPGTLSTALPSLPAQVSRLRHCPIRTSAATESILAPLWLNPSSRSAPPPLPNPLESSTEVFALPLRHLPSFLAIHHVYYYTSCR